MHNRTAHTAPNAAGRTEEGAETTTNTPAKGTRTLTMTSHQKPRTPKGGKDAQNSFPDHRVTEEAEELQEDNGGETLRHSRNRVLQSHRTITHHHQTVTHQDQGRHKQKVTQTRTRRDVAMTTMTQNMKTEFADYWR